MKHIPLRCIPAALLAAALLELLPDQFTFREVVQTRLREGKNEEGTYKMLRQWIYRGYIQQSTVDSYQKLKFRKDGTYIDKNY